MPLLGNMAAELLAPDLEATKLEHLTTHLMMEFNPSEQIRAQSKTERTITTFASKVLLPVYTSAGSWLFPGTGGGVVSSDLLE